MSGVSPQQVIFDVFNQAASAGWVRGEIDFIKVGKMAASDERAIAGDGSVSYPRIRGTAMDKAIWAIRSQMAQPGSGAWFSATIRLTPDGGFSMDANYDDEPAWDVPVVAGT